MRRLTGILVICASMMIGFSVDAHATPAPEPLIECPDHRHVWHKEQCERDPFGLPGGGGGGGRCGLVCSIGGLLGIGNGRGLLGGGGLL